ncbi:serine/threonine-protein kinase OXI1-like [Vigna umbellata]|uniref:serine/threonine-protein kinase OXI1-like n=1 Tax=Vigna umbellata TaxID=87088 RepID=UPI001F5FD7B0|nr:serine/threonine-protein kinase OXI1-like [Vigna umbellata]
MYAGDSDSNSDSGERVRRGETLEFQNLNVVSAVGRGAKGVVFLARVVEKGNGEWLALKVVSKELLRKKNRNEGRCKRVSFERHILRRFDHPLLPRFRGALDTDQLTGFAIDYCHGGNLHLLRKKQPEKTFSEDTVRFYAVELVLALEYLHNLGVVYRDLKPENIMIQESGHIMLVDFDLSKKLYLRSTPSSSCNSSPGSDSSPEKDRRKRRLSRFSCYCHSGISLYDSDIPNQLNAIPTSRSMSDSVEKSNSFVGTEEYVAPEVISGEGHDFAVDWWSLGIVLHELMYGTTPFKGANRKETFHRIITKEPELSGATTPLRDLIKKLLEKDPERRIQVKDIKSHDFFKGVKWDTILEISRPPYIPQNEIKDSTGFSQKDVESFVHRIFFPKSKEEEDKTNKGEAKRNEKETPKEENYKNEENDKKEENNKNVWVDKLNQNSAKDENFLIF